MKKLELHFVLQSDATFGRGDGVAGLVDQEVEYDVATGLPFLRGRTLRGLLVEECANILFALPDGAAKERFDEAASYLFGRPGSQIEDEGYLTIGAAQLPSELRQAVEADVSAGRLTPTTVLDSLTGIRRQTAVDEETGAPDSGSLRAMRVILRQTPFMAELSFTEPESAELQQDALALLSATVLAWRRAGIGRNRGRGSLCAWLQDEAYTDAQFKHFHQVVTGGGQ